MKHFIACSLLLSAITAYAADGITIEYLADHSDSMQIAVATLWCSMQPEHVQKELKKVALIPMLNALEDYRQKDALPLCKLAVDRKAHQLAGMVRITESWTTNPQKSEEVAAHPEWSPWVLALYAHSRYQDQEKKEIVKSLLADAEQELCRLGFGAAYFGAAPEEDALCEESCYTLIANVEFEKEATKIFRKELSGQ